jgi:hypothetical protein
MVDFEPDEVDVKDTDIKDESVDDEDLTAFRAKELEDEVEMVINGNRVDDEDRNEVNDDDDNRGDGVENEGGDAEECEERNEDDAMVVVVLDHAEA